MRAEVSVPVEVRNAVGTAGVTAWSSPQDARERMARAEKGSDLESIIGGIVIP